MNEHDALNEDKIAEIETQAIKETASRCNVSEELVDEIIQDYQEMIENFEQYLNERYPEENMDTQPYVVMEITNKITRDIADKHGLDEEAVGMIIQYYTERIPDSLEREIPEELD
jgi:hypothetical protein